MKIYDLMHHNPVNRQKLPKKIAKVWVGQTHCGPPNANIPPPWYKSTLVYFARKGASSPRQARHCESCASSRGTAITRGPLVCCSQDCLVFDLNQSVYQFTLKWLITGVKTEMHLSYLKLLHQPLGMCTRIITYIHT